MIKNFISCCDEIKTYSPGRRFANMSLLRNIQQVKYGLTVLVIVHKHTYGFFHYKYGKTTVETYVQYMYKSYK